MGRDSMEVNRRGRLIFLLVILLAVVLMALMGVLMARVEASQRWIILGLLCTVALSAIWLSLIVFVRAIYRIRLVNVTLLILAAVACGGLGAASWQFAARHTLLLVAASVAVVLLVCAGVILAWRADSAMAHRIHPWVAFDDDYEGQAARRLSHPSSVGDLISSKTGGGVGRKVHLRKISVFQDWPAPQPFSAQALYAYRANSTSELSLSKGEQLTILDCRGNWWQAQDPVTGTLGFVPSNYLAVNQRLRVCKSHQAEHDDEVDVREGEQVECMERHEEACLIRNVKGQIGSVPTKCLE